MGGGETPNHARTVGGRERHGVLREGGRGARDRRGCSPGRVGMNGRAGDCRGAGGLAGTREGGCVGGSAERRRLRVSA